jgi:hypothetical protein
MKRQQVVLAIAALNAGIFAIAAFAINASAQAPALPQPDYQFSRVNWDSAATSSEIPQWGGATLSPGIRPNQNPTETDPVEVIKELTDAELRAELEAKIAREIKLLRIVYAEGRPEACFGKVRVANVEIVLAPNAGFLAGVAESRLKGLPAWLADVRVKDITADSVTLDAASSKPEKRFEIKLVLVPGSLITVGKIRVADPSGERVPFPPMPKGLEGIRDGKGDEKTKSTQNPDGSWKLGTEDLDNKEAIEAAANSLRVVIDENGNPLGLMIPEETPEDNLLIKRGGKRGDIIKSVNGKPVKMLADAKRTIREEYEAGIREFEIGYERDGNPGRQVFKLPQK